MKSSPPSPRRPLLRISALAFRYPITCAGVLFCSLAVAVLWGGNIGGLYPVLQVVISGESLQDWSDRKINDSQEQIDELHQQIATATAKTKPSKKDRQAVARWNSQLDLEEAALASARRLQSWVQDYLPNDPFMTIVVVVAALFVAILVRQLFLSISGMLQARLSGLISIQLQSQFFRHVLRVDLATLGRVRPSGMMTHINDTEKVSNGATLFLENGIRESAKLIVCLIGAGLICWRLLLLTLVLAPIAGLAIHTLGRSMRRTSDHTFEIGRNVKRVLFDVLAGLPVVQICAAEGFERKRFDGYMAETFRRKMKMALYGVLSKVTTETFGLGTVCLTLIAGAYLVLNEQTHILGIRMCDRPLSLAGILVFYGLLVGMNDPVRRFGGVFKSMQRAIAAANRLFLVLDEPAAIQEPENPVPLPGRHRFVEFQNIHFQYQEGVPVLNAVNLRVDAGETVAIVGANGSGKSSLVNLLPRFYDPNQGAVTIDGIDLRNVALQDLRRRIGYVMQNPILFDSTVRENIVYGMPQATEEQIVEAAKQAQAHAFITNSLADGYDSQVGANGDSLSGGQRQRIVLARMLLRDPEFVVLDEASSQIDQESKMVMFPVLEKFLRDRTTLIVTHRLATLELADRIAVMNDGELIAVDTHDGLLQHCELYRSLRSSEWKRSA